jgi:aspartate ammonia-lyase
MPGKVNPVIPEMVMQVTFRVMAHDNEVTMAASQGELELNPFLPLLGDALLNSLDLLSNTDQLFAERCIDGITADAERCRADMEKSAEVVTALIPAIEHARAVELAREMQEKKLTVREAAKGLLSSEQLDQLLSAEALCALGSREPDNA